jgi:hypothetical protein
VNELVPIGIRPQVMRKIERARIFLAPDFFMPPPILGPAHAGREWAEARPELNGRGRT